MSFVKELILSLRPWSFTASVIPVFVTAAAINAPFLSEKFLRAVVMALFIHAGANLTNTYYDFVLGVDTKTYNHDSTLVDQKLSPTSLFVFSIICYAIGIAAIVPTFQDNGITSLAQIDYQSPQFLTFCFFGLGVLLAFGYTGGSYGLKYFALGDITIFLCFGPLLMECVSLMLVNQVSYDLLYYTIPLGLLTEGILHTNNARDIKNDRLSGIITLATLLDFENSYYVYVALIIIAYSSALYIAYFLHLGCSLTFLTLPFAWQLMRKFQKQQMHMLTEETAQLHLLFGVFLFVGIVSTGSGFQAIIQK